MRPRLRLAPRQVTRLVWAAVAALLLAMALDGSALWRAQRVNQGIAQGRPASQPAVPELRFAQAHALAASGATDQALNAYRALQAEPALAQAARYNSANLLLRQAQQTLAGPQPGQAFPMVELAKELYRDVLRADPGHWAARYNLERAQRLRPDPEEEDNDALSAPRERERAATTMRAQSLGLP